MAGRKKQSTEAAVREIRRRTRRKFADSSLNLTLRAYTAALSDRLPAITELHKAIDQKFRAAGIVIAFPQRDVHFHSGAGGAVPPTVDGGSSENR